MAKQTRQAVAEADAVIFVVDVRAGVSGAGPRHRALPAHRRQEGAPRRQQGRGHGRVAAAGRVLRARPRRAAPDLGGARPGHPQPARGGARATSSSTTKTRPSRHEGAPIRLAVAGRPNVGKSTLINTWLGEERLVAFDQPGTTRDAITVPFERDGQKFELIDTAGLRRKGKVFEAIEKFSVVKTLQAIADAERRAAAARRDPGRDRPGRAHRRLHPRERPRRGDRGQQVGRGRRLPEARRCSARSSSAWRS